MFRHLPYVSKNLSVTYPDTIDVYELDEKEGVIKVVGQHNIQEEIDSYADEVDINNIIARCVDPSVLSCIGDDSEYDLTVLPEDINSRNAVMEAKFGTAYKIFDGLEPEQKAKFKSFSDFLNRYEEIFKANPIDEVPKENISEVKTNG